MESELKNPEEAKNFIFPSETSETKERQNSILTFEYGGVEIKIPYQTKHFEYSVDFQNRTGILGYERKIISKNSLYNALKPVFQLPNLSREDKYKINENVCGKFTDGHFPRFTYNYQMNWRHHGHDERDQANLKQLAEDRFLQQEVFGAESYRNLKNKGGDMLVDSRYNNNPDVSVFDAIDKGKNRLIERDNINIYDKYNNPSRKDKVSFISANGLNVTSGFIFSEYIDFYSSPSFGFDAKDKFFRDYLYKSIQRLSEINIADQSDSYPLRLFAEMITMLARKDNIPDWNSEIIDIDKETFLEYMKEFGIKNPPLYEKMHKIISDTENYHRSLSNYFHGSSLEQFHIPIFNNDNKIPQLRWGHCNYAIIPTKNNTNIIKMKHSAKVPVPK